MGVIVDVRLVFVFAPHVLVRAMRVVHPRMVVVMGVHRRQMLYRSCRASFRVVGNMNVFVAVHDFLVIMRLKLLDHVDLLTGLDLAIADPYTTAARRA